MRRSRGRGIYRVVKSSPQLSGVLATGLLGGLLTPATYQGTRLFAMDYSAGAALGAGWDEGAGGPTIDQKGGETLLTLARTANGGVGSLPSYRWTLTAHSAPSAANNWGGQFSGEYNKSLGANPGYNAIYSVCFRAKWQGNNNYYDWSDGTTPANGKCKMIIFQPGNPGRPMFWFGFTADGLRLLMAKDSVGYGTDEISLYYASGQDLHIQWVVKYSSAQDVADGYQRIYVNGDASPVLEWSNIVLNGNAANQSSVQLGSFYDHGRVAGHDLIWDVSDFQIFDTIQSTWYARR